MDAPRETADAVAYERVAGASEYEPPPTKASRFPTYVFPAIDEAQALEGLAQARAAHPSARHHCWAYHLSDGRYRSSDDGEPGGSAGRPILAVLTGRDVRDTMIVVVRYFGGVKLGVGGLMRAYGGAAAQALDRAEVVAVVPSAQVGFKCSYPDAELLRGQLSEFATDFVYGAVVQVQVEIPVAQVEALCEAVSEATAGRVQPQLADPAAP